MRQMSGMDGTFRVVVDVRVANIRTRPDRGSYSCATLRARQPSSPTVSYRSRLVRSSVSTPNDRAAANDRTGPYDRRRRFDVPTTHDATMMTSGRRCRGDFRGRQQEDFVAR